MKIIYLLCKLYLKITFTFYRITKTGDSPMDGLQLRCKNFIDIYEVRRPLPKQ